MAATIGTATGASCAFASVAFLVRPLPVCLFCSRSLLVDAKLAKGKDGAKGKGGAKVEGKDEDGCGALKKAADACQAGKEKA